MYVKKTYDKNICNFKEYEWVSEVTKDGNDNESVKKTIVSFMRKMGYIVNDTSGRTNYSYNLFEFIVQSMYFFLSIYNAISLVNPAKTISLAAWMINILVLAKTWVKNMKNAHKLDKGELNIKELEHFCGVVRVQVKVYERKMIFTNVMLGIAGSLILYSLIFGYTSAFDPKAMVGIIVVVTSFVDGILSIFEDMYQAIPKSSNILTMIDER